MSAEIIDIATGERITPPAVAQDVFEDARGRYVLVDGARIPVRNGGPVGGLSPLEDWRTAREVEQQIVAGEGIAAAPFSWRNLFGATLAVSTAASGWTTYRVTGEPGGVLWWLTAWLWLASTPFVAFAALTNLLWIPLWTAAFVGWTWLCLHFCEPGTPAR